MNKEQRGIDWSKEDMYEGIGRPDLKPKVQNTPDKEQDKGEAEPTLTGECPDWMS